MTPEEIDKIRRTTGLTRFSPGHPDSEDADYVAAGMSPDAPTDALLTETLEMDFGIDQRGQSLDPDAPVSVDAEDLRRQRLADPAVQAELDASNEAVRAALMRQLP